MTDSNAVQGYGFNEFNGYCTSTPGNDNKGGMRTIKQRNSRWGLYLNLTYATLPALYIYHPLHVRNKTVSEGETVSKRHRKLEMRNIFKKNKEALL